LLVGDWMILLCIVGPCCGYCPAGIYYTGGEVGTFVASVTYSFPSLYTTVLVFMRGVTPGMYCWGGTSLGLFSFGMVWLGDIQGMIWFFRAGITMAFWTEIGLCWSITVLEGKLLSDIIVESSIICFLAFLITPRLDFSCLFFLR